MGTLFLLLIIVAIVFMLDQNKTKNSKGRRNHRNDVLDQDTMVESLPYIKKASITSPAEFSFYKVIENILQDEYIICPKVSLSDIFEVKVNGRDRMKYFNKISRKHVDFLICEKVSMKPIIGIELDDQSHNRKNRIERDIFVNRLFEHAHLKLLHFKVKSGYVSNDLKESIENEINAYFEEVRSNKEYFICPNCKVYMIKRIAKSGINKGKEFYGCPNFPDCKEIINIK